MATFSQFPNEMITAIWEYVLEPQDVESFALVSKRIYAIGAPFVDEHNKLKKEYSFSDTVVHESLLKKILLWPRVALYVTHLSIGDYQNRWDDDDLLSYQTSYSDDDIKFIIEVVRRADSVPRNEIEDWVTAVKDGNEDPIVALLLLLLPNLCTMTLAILPDSFCRLAETFRRISETKNSPFLTRLATINLDFYSTSEDDFMAWKWINMSAKLPSVQSIHVEDIRSNNIEDMIRYRQCFKPGSSTIKELVLAESKICPQLMIQLFSSFKALKKFTYSSPDVRFEPFWMGKALVAFANHSLESLKITAERTGGVGTLGSFRGCTILQELETDVHLLVEKDRFHTLVDLLPGSIEKVHLHTGYYSRCASLSLIVEVFKTAKSQLLPNMRMLTLSLEPWAGLSQEDKELIKTWEKTCSDLGIELSVIKGENNRKDTALVPAL